MRDHFGQAPAGLLVGMMQEKDHDGFFRALAQWPGWRWVWCYPVRSPRTLDAPSLAAVARRHFRNTRVYQNLDQALESLERLTDKRLRIVATGSLYSIARLEQWGVHHGPLGVQTKVDQAQAEQGANH
jgi:folylpolyglutamate synthase/dihydropteroate synthase